MQTLVLASTSPWRRALLESAGVSVRAVAPGVDERSVQAELPDAGPADVALALARAKAEAVAATNGGAFVLGADQVLWDGRELIGKPADPGAHLRRLQGLRGRSHELLTGWCLVVPSGAQQAGIERTVLTMRADLTDAELRAYVATGEGSGCAGGYAVEGHGAWLFERIDGDWSNVVGLPVFAVITALRQHGWRYPGDEGG